MEAICGVSNTSLTCSSMAENITREVCISTNRLCRRSCKSARCTKRRASSELQRTYSIGDKQPTAMGTKGIFKIPIAEHIYGEAAVSSSDELSWGGLCPSDACEQQVAVLILAAFIKLSGDLSSRTISA